MTSERMKLWWSLRVPCIYTHAITAGDSGLRGCVVSLVAHAVSSLLVLFVLSILTDVI